MKIMTFNTQHCMNYITRETDYEIMADTINKFAPDFVVLNEMRDTGEADGFDAQTEKLAALCGMEHYYFAKAIDVYEKSSPYGNAIISKIPLESVETVHIPDPTVRNGSRWYESRCIIKAKLECGLTVLGIHAGLNPEEHELAISTVIENAERETCVLLGDFNMTPKNEKLLPLKDIFKDTADVFSEPLLSCPSDVPTKKIDYIFVTPDIDVVSADIPEVVASDHRPVIAEIKLPTV